MYVCMYDDTLLEPILTMLITSTEVSCTFGKYGYYSFLHHRHIGAKQEVKIGGKNEYKTE